MDQRNRKRVWFEDVTSLACRVLTTILFTDIVGSTDKVLELGGTVTGEHGVSITKAPYMKKERADSLDAMRRIKKALDPKNIMNPGKIFDWEGNVISHLRYPAFIETEGCMPSVKACEAKEAEKPAGQ